MFGEVIILEQIIEYIKRNYNPISIILYGSYADGTNNLNSDFVQIFDGKIIVDSNERGKALQMKVISHIQNRPQKSKAEIDASVDWCMKMFERVKRNDVEGMFRWHWVLIDSLEIFCDLMQYPYFGPKKTLKWMEQNHPIAFAHYKTALEDFSVDSLKNWITYIKNANDTF